MPMIELLNIDCLKYMESQPDDSIDCIIADPPYGIAYQSAWRSDKTKWKAKIANDEKPFTEWITPAFRILKEGGRLICFYRWDVQDEFYYSIIEAGFEVKSQVVWDKIMHGMGDLKGEYAPQHELMIYATKGRYEFKGKRPKTVYKEKRVDAEKLIHPNEKPVNLIRKILIDITTPEEIVFDPFSGSGSTLMACKEEGRNFKGTELMKDYFDLAQKRIKNETAQIKLL